MLCDGCCSFSASCVRWFLALGFVPKTFNRITHCLLLSLAPLLPAGDVVELFLSVLLCFLSGSMARKSVSADCFDMQVPSLKVRRLNDSGGALSSPASRLLLAPASPSLMTTVSSAATGRISSSSRAAASSRPAVVCNNVIKQLSGSSGSGSREFAAQFAILEPLEASALYRCLDKESLQEYVCKVVPTQSYTDYLSGYLRMNGNPGINPIESVFVGGKQTHILFKPSHGDLHSYVRSQKRLSESEAMRLFHQIAVIVNDCHENGICLRDLKLRKFVFRDPEKTMLKLETLDDAVVLEDPDDDLLGEKHGCPVYASPEILSTVNGRYSGRAADCWSLGVILFTMLVGRYPFHDTNPTHLFGKIRRGLFQIPNSISPLARVVINSLLRKDPAERMTAEDLLASHLFSVKFLQQHATSSSSSLSTASSSSLSSRSSGYPSSSSLLIHLPLTSLTSFSSQFSSSSLWHETL